MKSIFFLAGLVLSLIANQAYAQTPDAVVSSYFQGLNNNAAVASGALQKTAVKPRPSRKLTPMLMFAKANWNQLTPATQASVSPWLARPDNSVGSPPSGVSFYTSTQVVSTITSPSGNFVFHFIDAATYPADTNRATAAFVNSLATIADNVWTKEIGTMGYNAPPSDGTLGGSAIYDIYLLNTGAVGIYGYVTSDSNVYTPATPFPHTVYTHMVVDNDFSGFPQAPLDAAKVTLAHEFFHSIQNGYDRAEFPAFLESLSTWMEDKVYPTIKDNLQYIGEPFTDSNGDGQYTNGEPFTDHNGNGLRESGSQDYPELHLDSFGLSGNRLEQYGRFMWIRYLSDKFGDALINTILTNTGNTAGNNTYTAIDAALQAQGSSLAAAFHEFGIWNIDVGKYTNGADYPIAWGDRLFNNGAINISSDATQSLSPSFFAGKQKHLSTIYELVNSPNATYTFTTNGNALLSALVQNTVGGAYTVQPIALTSGQGTWSAPAGTTKVTFVISNTSPTDDTMTWRLTDGVTAPLPSLVTSNNSTTTSSSSSGCITSIFSPYLLAWLGLLLLPIWRRKK